MPGSSEANERVKFLVDLSDQMLHSHQIDPNLVAFGHWIRPTNLKKMLFEASGETPRVQSSGFEAVGTIFQVAPNNVDFLFLYVWAIGVLLGNNVLTKMGSSEVQAHSEALGIVERVAQKYPLLPHFDFFRTEHDSRRVQETLNQSDVSVIWGSDKTVEAFKRMLNQPRDLLTFPHRFSIALVDGERYSSLPKRRASYFRDQLVRDVIAFNQMACTSPKCMVFVGGIEYEDEFNEIITHLGDGRAPTGDSSVAYNRQLAFTRLGLERKLTMRTELGSHVLAVTGHDRLSEIREDACVAGVLPVIRVTSSEDLVGIIDREIQTISHLGLSETTSSVFSQHLLREPLREVMFGETHRFHWNWEGINLVSKFSRKT